MKKYNRLLVLLLAVLLVSAVLTGCDEKETAPSVREEDHSDARVLVVYFSYTGHLDRMAHWIADETSGDIVRVTAKEPYPDDYDKTVDRAKQEHDDETRPEIEIDLTQEQLAEYDTVFFGFPVWWYDLPMPMWTFLESYDFAGKTIIPFISHEGTSNGGSAFQNMKELAPDADIRSDEYLSIRGGKVDSSEQDVRSWVSGLGYSK